MDNIEFYIELYNELNSTLEHHAKLYRSCMKHADLLPLNSRACKRYYDCAIAISKVTYDYLLPLRTYLSEYINKEGLDNAKSV